MPYSVSVSKVEAEALAAAGVEGIQGCIFTYEPSGTLSLIQLVQQVEHEGSERIIGRLARLFGRWTMSEKQHAEETPSPALEQVTPPPRRRRKREEGE